SLGYTTLRAPAGHLIVLPNAIAASQVTLNLSTTFAPWPLAIAIRLSRDAGIEQARELALRVAKEDAGDKSVLGCFVVKIDASSMTLELRVVAADAAGRDTLRSKLLDDLARRFVEAHIGTNGAELPAFS
ncbi:MAG TPA: hypothetical protein VHV81_03905, partial [Steroidobacteraceae bacterium]|nr:hypothetical protein [Steroidobacteraceae bacterium]